MYKTYYMISFHGHLVVLVAEVLHLVFFTIFYHKLLYKTIKMVVFIIFCRCCFKLSLVSAALTT